MPTNVHLNRLNGHVDFGGFPMKVPSQSLPSHESDLSERPPWCSSSFGFAGTNAHVVFGRTGAAGRGGAGCAAATARVRRPAQVRVVA